MVRRKTKCVRHIAVAQRFTARSTQRHPLANNSGTSRYISGATCLYARRFNPWEAILTRGF